MGASSQGGVPLRSSMRRQSSSAVTSTKRSRAHIGEVALANDMGVVVRVTDPVPGFLSFSAHDRGDEGVMAVFGGHLFSEALLPTSSASSRRGTHGSRSSAPPSADGLGRPAASSRTRAVGACCADPTNCDDRLPSW